MGTLAFVLQLPFHFGFVGHVGGWPFAAVVALTMRRRVVFAL